MGYTFSIPAGVGSANNGSNLGVSVLNSNNVASNSNANYGGTLTPIIIVATKKKILNENKKILGKYVPC